MSLRKAIIKTLIVFAMLILMLGIFSLLFGFFDTATAPHEIPGGSQITEIEQPSPPGDALTPVSPNSPHPPDTADVLPGVPDRVLIRMEPADIHKGNLLLINHDHRYELPDLSGFVLVADSKTPSYRTTSGDLILSESVIGPLNAMMDAYFSETGLDTVAVISAFRDFDRQQEILNEYISLVGRIEAHRWAALPGHSEHHAGLAVDLGFYNGGTLRTFLGTGVYAWFSRNSFDYGFILRFPREKTDVTDTAYEPWHYRYVGLPHSYFMHENDWCLEEYIEHMWERSSEDPYIGQYDGVSYEIYFTPDFDIFIPFDCEFDISGNNIDGFIVTINH